jgi:hypothetical protein
MNKIPKKHIQYRALLTETLPYEKPIIFSNDFYFNHANKPRTAKEIKAEFKLFNPKEKHKERKGFDYRIIKGSGEERILTLIHPSVQLKISRFIEANESIILHYCGKSKFSLRYPAEVEKVEFFEVDVPIEHSDDADIQEELTLNGKAALPKVFNNYFQYAPFSYLHGFYSSRQFLRCEKRYSHLFKLDVSKCFYSIYTHTIAWATKGFEYGKKHRTQASFENTFDTLIREGNEGITNGIVVGPEFSRIFAEIILQEIDKSVRSSLELDKIIYGKDYEMHRYIDDYFIFTNSKEKFSRIEFVLKEELRKFKLYTNESKRSEMSRPFMTNISAAKMDVKEFLTQLFSPDAETKHAFPEFGSRSSTIINRIKKIVHTNDVSYSDVGAYSMSSICIQIEKIISKLIKSEINEIDSSTAEDLIKIVEVVFFLFGVDPRVRSTILLARFLIAIKTLANKLPSGTSHELYKFIEDELRKAIDCVSNLGIGSGVELSNLLIISRNILPKEFMPEVINSAVMNPENKQDLRYSNHFFAASAMYYIGKSKSYPDASEAIWRFVKSKIRAKDDIYDDAEAYICFFDFMSCNYIDIKRRREILKIGCKISDNSNPRLKLLMNEFQATKWFTEWDRSADFQKLIWKLDRKSVY